MFVNSSNFIVMGLLCFRYVSVDEAELFYYFIESEGNPKEDPLLLWYSGGPGCSALNGLIYENGIISFTKSLMLNSKICLFERESLKMNRVIDSQF